MKAWVIAMEGIQKRLRVKSVRVPRSGINSIWKALVSNEIGKYLGLLEETLSMVPVKKLGFCLV